MSGDGVVRIAYLGGLGEIGMNCMAIEFEDEMIVIDCGVYFSDLEDFGVEVMVPNFGYLLERKNKLKAFICTHGHEDHIGALPFALRAGLRAPVYASPFTAELVRSRVTEHGMADRLDLRLFRPGQSFKGRRFSVSTVPVNHSIVEASALIIETPAGRIIHTGDFKVDSTPYYGKAMDFAPFLKAGDDGVLLLMSDSTNVERTTPTETEGGLLPTFEKIFAAAEGLVIVSLFSSNIGRIGQILDVAGKLGKKVAIAGRSIERNVQIAIDRGYLEKGRSQLISMDDVSSHDRRDLILIATGSQGEYKSTLARLASGEHRALDLQNGDLVVFSSKFIPGNEKAIGHMINNLFAEGADVYYEAVREVHVSGHASRPELKRMLEATRPQHFIPIHGEYRHLVHHARLAEETGVRPENISIFRNGDVIELTRAGAKRVEQIEDIRVMIDRYDLGALDRSVLKERRKLAEGGSVFVMVVRSREDGRVISGPEVVTYGLVNPGERELVIEESMKAARRSVSEWNRTAREGASEADLQEHLRVELRRFYAQHIGRKPVVVPLVINL